jgi:hypothetical protein
VPKNAIDDLRRTYEFERVMGWKEALKRGLDPSKVYWVTMEKILRYENDKREFSEDGDSKPIALNILD